MSKARIVWFVSVTLIDEIAVAIIILLVLPLFGINLPLFVLVSVLLVFSALAFLFYRALSPVINRKPVIGHEAMIGMIGTVVTPLSPEGLVEMAGEVWRARSTDGNRDSGEKILVVEVKGLKLMVTKGK